MFVMLYLFFLIHAIANSTDDLCNYIITRSESILEICTSNTCEKYLDPFSLLVKPNDCKTTVVHLAFSSYGTYQAFLNRIPWKLSDLFARKSSKTRRLRVYIDELHSDDRPTDLRQLSQLGNEIDLYQLYIRTLPTNHSFQRLLHYDPQWFILQIQFICNSIIKYHEQACATQILPPSRFAPQRAMKLSTKILSVTTTEQIFQQNQRSIDSILLILIPVLILSITIILTILIYRKVRVARHSQTDLTISSVPSISNNLHRQNRSSHPIRADVQPYQISSLPLPHEDSLYKEVPRHL